MIEKQKIEGLVEEFVRGTGLFLVSVKVSNANRIIVLADKNEGITIDECAAIHRHIENGLDRNKEDFELQVSSPGLDVPFGVIEQYFKNEGKKVEVVWYNKKGDLVGKQSQPLGKGEMIVLGGNAPNSTCWLLTLKRLE